MKLHGFTLAEVLITLGIIGVVAAMTLPTLNQKLQAQENMSTLKKVYSTLQQATNLAISEHEHPEHWGMVDNSVESITKIYNYYKPNFKIMRNCPNEPGCWGYPTRYLNSGVYWNAHSTDFYQYAFTLVDGVNVLMDIYPRSSINNDFGVEMNMDCVVFWVDVNADKQPNKIGHDIFAFVVTKKGLQPAGLNNTENCKTDGSGWSCAARIIQDGWTIKYIQ